MDKRRKYQLARIARGLCIQCPGRLHLYTERCDACMAVKRLKQRARSGHTPWRPGSRGRRPKCAILGAAAHQVASHDLLNPFVVAK